MNLFISPQFLEDTDILTLTQFEEQSPWYELGVYAGYCQCSVVTVLEPVCADLGITLIESDYLDLDLCNKNIMNWHLPLIIEEISQWDNLRGLYLRSNQLTHLCPEIGNLINLTEIDLSDNQLIKLCPEIGNLVNLTTLYLYGNKLTQLCPEIGNLAYLYLRKNQLPNPCPEIFHITNLFVRY